MTITEKPASEKEWLIPVCWEMSGLVKIKAQTLSEAMELVENIGEIPYDADYVDDSYQLVTYDEDYIRESFNDGEEDIENYEEEE